MEIWGWGRGSKLEILKDVRFKSAKHEKVVAVNQRKIKGQQLKGKIDSENFTLSRSFFFFHTSSEFFPQDFPLQNKGFERNENKRRTGRIDVAR